MQRAFPLTLFLVLALTLAAACPALSHDHERAPKTGILIAAFGSTVPEGRAALDHVDARVRAAFPDLEVRWAYTSSIVRHVMAREQGIPVDSPAMALARMMDDGFTTVAVMSLHTIPGEEYGGLLETARAFAGMPKGMDAVAVSDPLLTMPEDLERAADAILAGAPAERAPGDAVILMGHGTRHPGDAMYAALQYHLWRRDPNVFVGTVEGTPSLDDVLAQVAERGLTRAYVLPFMAVAGDHARNDMAGDDPDSWKSRLAAAGVDAVFVLKGTAEYDAVVDIWIDHLRRVLEQPPADDRERP